MCGVNRFIHSLHGSPHGTLSWDDFNHQKVNDYVIFTVKILADNWRVGTTFPEFPELILESSKY